MLTSVLPVVTVLLCYYGLTVADHDIRLVGNGNEQKGVVEIMYQGKWGTICDDGWDDIDATVVCRELGFLTGAVMEPLFQISQGPVWLHEVECLGNESKLSQCSHNGVGSVGNCTHEQDAAVQCSGINDEPINNGTLRLVGENSHREGSVEMFVDGLWVRVCDSGWDDTDAGVVCRQLGFGLSGKTEQFQISGSGNDEEIGIPKFSCVGSETELLNCSHTEIGIEDCDNFDNVGVICTGATPALPIRLADGSLFPLSGRVEIYRNGVWGTVCDKYWNITNSQVVCKQLGYGTPLVDTDLHVPAGKGPILLDNVSCSHNQTSLLACSHNGFENHKNCGHVEDVGVSCLSDHPLIRLVEGNSSSEGRVEVYYNGEWGTVCDDEWDDTDASVVCRQLGFGSSGLAVYSAAFGQGSGPIFLDNVLCDGSEATLAKCGHLGVSITRSCSHGDDAGVRCLGGQDILVKLVPENSYNEGRVEVRYNGEWGAVSYSGWDDTDAGVVCRQLGFESSGTAIELPNTGQRPFLEYVQCTGNESFLASCGHPGVKIINPFSTNYSVRAGVRCDGDRKMPPVIYVHPSDRIVEISNTSTNIVLTCMAYGASHYQWLKDNNTIQLNTTENVTNSLILANISLVDSGRYQCVAKNKYGRTSSDFAELIVEVLPPVVSISPALVSTTEGGHAEFNCLATGVGLGDFEYQWSFNNSLIPRQNTSTLIINNITHGDDGNYACSVRNSYEGIGHSGVARLMILVPPLIYVHPLDKMVEISNTSTDIVLTCMAYGASDYQWLKDNNTIEMNTTGNVTNNLLLTNISPSDSGRYQCVAVNKNGRSYSDFAELIVEVLPPLVTISPALINITEGGHAEFKCFADGVGSSHFEYQWNFNQHLIPGQSTSILIINNITYADSGDYTCSVRNQYEGIGHSGVARLVTSDQSCQSVTVNYQGFKITWNDTLAGTTVEVPCVGTGLNGVVRRRCISGDEWEENFGCIREETENLLNQATNLTLLMNDLSQNETIAQSSNIAAMLVSLTTPEEVFVYANEIDLAVTIVSALNNITATVVNDLTADSALLEDTATILDNLLSDENQDNWKQLEMISPTTSQALVNGAEVYTKLLSETLTNDTTEIVKAKRNIVIKVERTSDEDVNKGYTFPDEDDDLTNYEGERTQLMIPSSLLQDINTADSTQPTIASMLIRNGHSLRLPNSGNRTALPSVPASSILSLQINPIPDSAALAKNPIMMMFDVQSPPSTTLSEENGAQYPEFSLQDASCNFYDYNLPTNNFNQVGGWSTKGLVLDESLSDETSVTCLTQHLTSFAVLIKISGTDETQPSTPSDDDKALSIISYIGCSISLVCLCLSIIILSIVMYKTNEKKSNHLFIHLNLCIALALGLVVFIAGIERATDNENACKAVAALLQYLFTSAFCWMLCEGVMLYMMLVTVFGNKLNRRRFFFILGWGPAIVIVAISVGLAHEQYGTEDYCWIKSDNGAIIAFIAPIGAIMLINCIFLMITLKVLCASKRQSLSSRATDTAKDLIKAIVVLLPLLGLTWIIGIITVNNETQAFAWIFAILNSLQGVFIFVFHVLRNKQIARELKLWYNIMQNRKEFRKIHLAYTSGSASGMETTSKEKSNYGMKMSTTSAESSTAILPKSAIEDSVFNNDESQINMKLLEESFIDTGIKEKQPTKDDANAEEKKSITEEDGVAVVAENLEATDTKPAADSLPHSEK